MTKQMLNKLLSVILALAICSATVFGCLIAVNAADSPTFVFDEGELSADSASATIDVTFTVPTGTAAGVFTVGKIGNKNDQNDCFSSVTATIIGGTPLSGSFSADDFNVTTSTDGLEDDDVGLVFFEVLKEDTEGSIKYYKSVTFELTLTFANGSAASEAEYTVSVGDFDFSGTSGTEHYAEFSGTSGVIKTGCDHVITTSSENLIATYAESGYAVYKDAVCSVCGETFAYQVEPLSKEESTEGTVSKWAYTGGSWYDKTLADNDETGTETDPIIIDSANELAYLLSQAGSESGKYYKVADGIAAFDMNAGKNGEYYDMSGDMTTDEVESKLSSETVQTWWGQTFKGNFDGNGVVIYGLVATNYGSLFGYVAPGATIKNFTLKNSYFYGDTTGAILSKISASGSVTIENCILTNNVIVCKRLNDGEAYGGVMAGYLTNGYINVNNCLVYGNVAKHESSTTSSDVTVAGYDITYGLIGAQAAVSSVNGTVKNSVILDCFPFGVNYNYASNANMTFENVYTNMAGKTIVNTDFTSSGGTEYTYTVSLSYGGIISLIKYDKSSDSSATITSSAKNIISVSASDIKGASAYEKMSALDWDNDWACDLNGGYPVPKIFASAVTNTVTACKLLAVNVGYNDNGSFSLNFHFSPISGADNDLYLCLADGTKDMTITSDDAVTSPFAGKGLPSSAMMYTIENLSAKDISLNWLATRTSGQYWGKTEQISVADYATKVMNGEAYYDSTATASQKKADINVAAAVLNYGDASTTALSTGYDYQSGETVHWSGEVAESIASTAEGTESDPIIIASAEELAYLLTTDVSEDGKYYKVADGISAFDMNIAANFDMSGDMTAENVKAILGVKNPSTTWSGGTFSGTFDGNGVVIYGLNSNVNGSLFGTVAPGTVIKNLTVKNSYFGGNYTAALVSQISESGTIAIENCILANNAIVCTYTNGAESFAGVMVGYLNKGYADISNCLVYGNIANHQGDSAYATGYDITYGLIGYQDKVNDVNGSVKNSIILDCFPFGVNYNYASTANMTFENVYTNMVGQTITNTDFADKGATKYQFTVSLTALSTGKTKLTVVRDNITTSATNTITTNKDSGAFYSIDADDVKGVAARTNASNLDWENIWSYGMFGEYPTFAGADTTATSTAGTVSKWYYDTTSKSYYDSTLADNDETGTEDDPIIIDSANEFAYLLTSSDEPSEAGKYYKVADGITAFDMNITTNDDMSGDMTAEEIESILGSVTAKTTWWNRTFKGNFDGNGIEIYGLIAAHAGSIFGTVTAGTTIKNLTVKNSYFYGEAPGVIASKMTGSGTITIENCIIANNVIVGYRKNGAEGWGGVMIGYFSTGYADINNCLVYGNVAKHQGYYDTLTGYDITYGLVGYQTSVSGANGSVKNSIILDCFPFAVAYNYASSANMTFENVYTNMIDKEITNTDFDSSGSTKYNYTISLTALSTGKTKLTVVRDNITTSATNTITTNKDSGAFYSVEASDLKGASAAEKMPNLDWNTTANPDGVWYVGNEWNYPDFKESTATMPNSAQILYDAMVIDQYDDYGDSTVDFGVYATSLNLKANPYIAFTFAFNGDYKTNRDEIVVTFKNSSGQVIKTTTVGDGEGGVSEGWTNNANAGRYHLYRLTDINVGDLANYISVSVKYGDNDEVSLGEFSVQGFILDLENANRIAPCAYYTSRIQAAKALLFYAKMIDARYENSNYDDNTEVDICDSIVRGYLSASTVSRQYYYLSTYSGTKLDYQNISLDWTLDGSSTYTVYISENEDYSDAYTIETTTTSFKEGICVPGKTYYWKVLGTKSSDILGSGKMTIKNSTVRWIYVDGVSNVRDMGGWKTSSGKTVKYGMMYRGQKLDSITESGIKTIKALGIKTEFDLRYSSNQLTESPAGLNYNFFETNAQYDWILKESYSTEVKANFKAIFAILSDESNYPIYTHCSAGADRTGTFAFITNGLLGVSYEDLTRDFELTSFSSSGKRWRGAGTNGTFASDDLIMQQDSSNYVAWGKLYQAMINSEYNTDGNLSNTIQNFLVNYVGVPQSQIDSFKSIMLQ